MYMYRVSRSHHSRLLILVVIFQTSVAESKTVNEGDSYRPKNRFLRRKHCLVPGILKGVREIPLNPRLNSCSY